MTALQAAPAWAGYESATPAKFAPPNLPRYWVRRDRLNQQLSLAAQHPLTIVTGCPGAGKSVLLTDWAEGWPGPGVAWLIADETDNEPPQFWRDVMTTLRTGQSDSGPRTGRWSRPDDRSVEVLLRRSLAGRPRVLIVDDSHLITSETILASVASLACRMPSLLRVVLVGQRAPGFPLQRLIMSGEAAVLGDADLRFTVEEYAALVAMVARTFVPADQLETLTERAEGWAAALHLAALALKQDGDPSGFVRRFSGNFGPVADYMEHEVLARQPPRVVRFLLQTSVLDDLTTDLCRAVTGCDDAEEILRSLANRSLFVEPIGSGDRGYRYHRLFGDLLRSRLARSDPALRRSAELDAACWFEQRGDARSAAHHFAEAGAYERALSSVFSGLVQNLEYAVPPDDGARGRPGIPEAYTGQDPAWMYIVAATLVCAQRAGEAVRALGRLDALTAGREDRQLWEGRAEFLWAVHADRLGDAVSVLDHCRGAKELLTPTTQPGRGVRPGPDASWVAAVDASIAVQLPLLIARAHAALGELDEAQSVLEEQFATSNKAEASEPSTLATIACGQGRLRDGYRLGRAALEREANDSRLGGANIDARLAVAEVLFEHNELDQAEEQLEAALRLCPQGASTHWAWAVEVDLVRLIIAQQRHGDALNRIGRLRQLGLRNPPPHRLLQKLNRVEIGCRLSLGDLEGALLVARSIDSHETSCQTLARIDLSSGRPDRALARLAAGPSAALGNEIRRLVLVACAEMQHGRAQLAEEALKRAVDAARPEGFLRPFLEEARQVLPALRAISSNRRDPYVAQLIDQAEQAVPATVPGQPGGVLEPLTARERQVLGYLPSHLSCGDIAARIYVSPNTVKSHLKAIYRKMGAASRGEAVDIAVFRGLL